MATIRALTGVSSPLAKLIAAVSSALGVCPEPPRSDRKAKPETETVARLIFGNKTGAKDLARRAKARVDYREVRRQRNIERIIELAQDALPETVDERPVDEDWLAYFFHLSQDVGNAVMQTLWARLLAGEISQPGTYSLRTLNAVRTLQQDDAHLFSRYCCYVWEMGNGAKGVFTSAQVDRWLAGQGFASLEIERLRQLQLVGSALRYSVVEVELTPSARYFGEQYRFTGSLISILSRYISAVHLTDIGAELFPLAGAHGDPAYLKLLIRSLKEEDGIVVSRVDASS